jgi:modulator of FtsH protease
MNPYGSPLSAMEKLSTTTTLSAHQSLVIKQTYALLGLAVVAAITGGVIGSSSTTLARFFSSWMGMIVAIVALNGIPMVALAVRDKPMLGVFVLFADGLVSGLVLSPVLFFASRVAPGLIFVALAITALVFLAVTGYVFLSGRTFSAPRGLMIGMFVSIMAAVLLNSFMNIGWLGMLISAGIGIMGVLALVSSTSGVLHSPDSNTPVAGALALFAGVFNVFVAALHILLRLAGVGGRRDD